MPSQEKQLSTTLRELVKLVEEEASRNPAFARRVEAILGQRGAAKSKKPGARLPLPKDIPDVFSVLAEKGETEFRFWLRDVDLQMLKAIVKANGFDVARISQKWADPDKFIDLISEQTAARLRRGAGFLPERKADLLRTTVHAFEVYDIRVDRYVRAPRKATIEAIGKISGARAIPGTAEDVGEKDLDGDGMYG